MRRRGHWERVLPCKDMSKYLQYFEFPRYRNIVLAKWMQQPVWSLLVPYLNSSALLACNTLSDRSVSDTRGISRAPSSSAVSPEARRVLVSATEAQRRTKSPAVRAAHSAHGRARSPSPSPNSSRSLGSPNGRALTLSRVRSSSPLATMPASGSTIPLPRVPGPASNRAPPGGFLLLEVPLPGEIGG